MRSSATLRSSGNAGWIQRKQSRLSWLCLDDAHITPNRVDSGQTKACCFKKCSPFTLTSFSAAGDSQHVEVTHQVGFQVRIGMRDQRRQDELDDQQSAVVRDDGAAVFENGDRVRIAMSVQDMLEHVHVGSGGNGLGEIGCQQAAPGGCFFGGEARFGYLNTGLEINEHAAKMGMEFEHGKEK